MRLYAYCFILMVIGMLPLQGSLYTYPQHIRPEVSLSDACAVAQRILKTRGEEKRYFITSVSLFGSKEQDGRGAWNLWHYDKDGNKVNVFIPFPDGNVGLHYYPSDYNKNGGDKELYLAKTAKQMLAEQGGADQPATAPQPKSPNN